MRWWIGWLLVALAAGGVGCPSSDTFTLRVDLRTDYRPGHRFDTVRARIVSAPNEALVGAEIQAPADASADYITGVRIGAFTALDPGDYTVVVAVLQGGAVLADRTAEVRITQSFTYNAVISASCADLTCPGTGDPSDATECEGARCVLPTCTPENPEACPPICTGDDMCPAVGDCLSGRCVEGSCFRAADDSLCPSGSFCDSTGLCEPLPMTGDMGTPLDGGPIDGGPLKPTLEIETPQAGGCIDLGMAYPSGDDFTLRRTVTGPPNGAGRQINTHTSCAGSPVYDAAEDPITLGADGRDVNTLYTGVLEECWGLIYGEWSVQAQIDGVTSDPVTVTYYNSRCPNVATCAAARSFCSPCVHACDESVEYCRQSTGTCAPKPQLTIETSNGPGCVDLGEAHVAPDPPAINVIVTGRRNATSTQYNRQVSCSGSTRTAADVRTLDGTGRVEEPLYLTTPSSDCGSPTYGRWEVDVEVDGRRSNAVEVVYYNSSCSGVATCSQARTHCP